MRVAMSTAKIVLRDSGGNPIGLGIVHMSNEEILSTADSRTGSSAEIWLPRYREQWTVGDNLRQQELSNDMLYVKSNNVQSSPDENYVEAWVP